MLHFLTPSKASADFKILGQLLNSLYGNPYIPKGLYELDNKDTVYLEEPLLRAYSGYYIINPRGKVISGLAYCRVSGLLEGVVNNWSLKLVKDIYINILVPVNDLTKRIFKILKLRGVDSTNEHFFLNEQNFSQIEVVTTVCLRFHSFEMCTDEANPGLEIGVECVARSIIETGNKQYQLPSAININLLNPNHQQFLILSTILTDFFNTNEDEFIPKNKQIGPYRLGHALVRKQEDANFWYYLLDTEVEKQSNLKKTYSSLALKVSVSGDIEFIPLSLEIENPEKSAQIIIDLSKSENQTYLSKNPYLIHLLFINAISIVKFSPLIGYPYLFTHDFFKIKEFSKYYLLGQSLGRGCFAEVFDCSLSFTINNDSNLVFNREKLALKAYFRPKTSEMVNEVRIANLYYGENSYTIHRCIPVIPQSSSKNSYAYSVFLTMPKIPGVSLQKYVGDRTYEFIELRNLLEVKRPRKNMIYVKKMEDYYEFTLLDLSGIKVKENFYLSELAPTSDSNTERDMEAIWLKWLSKKGHIHPALDKVLFLQWAILLCEKLEKLRNKHILHRDIKPENIIVDPETGALEIIDFGLSKLKSRTKKRVVYFEPPENLPTPKKYYSVSTIDGTLNYISRHVETSYKLDSNHPFLQIQNDAGDYKETRLISRNDEVDLIYKPLNFYSYKRSLKGTPLYLAPEKHLLQNRGYESEIFSLGYLLRWALGDENFMRFDRGDRVGEWEEGESPQLKQRVALINERMRGQLSLLIKLQYFFAHETMNNLYSWNRNDPGYKELNDLFFNLCRFEPEKRISLQDAKNGIKQIRALIEKPNIYSLIPSQPGMDLHLVEELICAAGEQCFPFASYLRPGIYTTKHGDSILLREPLIKVAEHSFYILETRIYVQHGDQQFFKIKASLEKTGEVYELKPLLEEQFLASTGFYKDNLRARTFHLVQALNFCQETANSDDSNLPIVIADSVELIVIPNSQIDFSFQSDELSSLPISIKFDLLNLKHQQVVMQEEPLIFYLQHYSNKFIKQGTVLKSYSFAQDLFRNEQGYYYVSKAILGYGTSTTIFDCPLGIRLNSDGSIIFEPINKALKQFEPHKEMELKRSKLLKEVEMATIYAGKKTQQLEYPYHAQRDELPWLLMPKIQGRTLEDLIANNVDLDKKSRIKLAIELCRLGLNLLDSGILHRDLNLSNIMVQSEDNIPLLIDFSLSRLIPRPRDLYVVNGAERPGVNEKYYTYSSSVQSDRQDFSSLKFFHPKKETQVFSLKRPNNFDYLNKGKYNLSQRQEYLYITRPLSFTSRSSTLKGTVSFLAPECFLYGQKDHATDLFSIGVILRLLFGDNDYLKCMDEMKNVLFQESESVLVKPASRNNKVSERIETSRCDIKEHSDQIALFFLAQEMIGTLAHWDRYDPGYNDLVGLLLDLTRFQSENRCSLEQAISRFEQLLELVERPEPIACSSYS